MNEENNRSNIIKKIILIAFAITCLVIIWNMSRSINNMQQELSSLRQELNSLYATINSQINGISANIDSSLKKESSIIADYSYQIQSEKINRDEKTIPLILAVRPKEHQDGLKTTFVMETEDGRIISAQGTVGEAYTYTAEMSVPMNNYLKLSVSLDYGTVQKSEKLEDLYQPFESYFMKTDSISSLTTTNSPLEQSKRRLEFGGTIDTSITTSGDGSNYPVSGEIQILKNESVIKKLPIKIGEDTPSDPINGNGAPAPAIEASLAGSCTTYYTELNDTVTLQGNDVVKIIVAVKDNYGFIYKQTVYSERFDKNGVSIPTNYSGEVVIE